MLRFRSAILVAGMLCTALLAGGAEQAPAREKTSKETWWSVRPLVAPPVPQVRMPGQEQWARTPIDAFILAGLQHKGLKPSPEADRRTLLRRVTFDLVGLPPTPEEIEAFLADTRPDAYERVVERLLASSHYGERWARHWMDVVHYAETHGHDQDRPRPNAWPYRDYLIRAFNDDRPYARFVQEQVAGDVLFPGEPSATVALGMLAAGPWDESSLRDIREDSIDREIGRYLDRDDIVTTVASAFLSATVHCARCHDHKFDPISQKDYYALQAVFAATDKAERPYDPDPRTAATRQALLAEKKQLDSLKPGGDSWLTAEIKAEVAAWEKEQAGTAAWHTLEPVRFHSSGGATLTPQPDRSLLAGGKRADVDTYTITAQTNLQGITAVCLEVLSDPSLPMGGPGRQDNGNLHLNELQLQAAPRGNPEAARPVALHRPSADFNQEGWTIQHAIDGNAQTAWGIYPRVGQSHRAVFELKTPLRLEGGAALTFVLQQTHGQGHLIGRLRLSATTSAHPAAALEAPEAVRAILAVPAAERSATQRGELARFVRLRAVERRLAALPPPQLVYAGASDFKPDGTFRPAGKPRVVHLLKRGNISRPGAVVRPGALACVAGLESRFRLDNPDDEGARRAALARWITDRRNPLTWRSIVNRVWHYHFGRGIVDTPGDLGRMGARPTHPELLDWLAANFRDSGGSLKQLHRLIVTSAAYRQASRHDPHAATVDADNRLLWRMNRQRLDAETLHDTVLVAAGKLDRTMGGPSVRQFLEKPGVHVTPVVDYLHFDVDRPGNHRRSVYRFVFRTLPDPFMEALDCPDASQLTPVRSTSVGALQALALLHNRFMVRMSEHLARRAEQASSSLPAQVRAVYRFTLGREPTASEAQAVEGYAARHGLANACRMILNSNEFLFVN
jgi:hypothetical protein